MAKVRLEIELEYDADLMHGDSAEGREWFFGTILAGSGGDLILHSNEIGDELGPVRVLKLGGQSVGTDDT